MIRKGQENAATLFPMATRTATVTSGAQEVEGYSNVVAYLNVTNVAGTLTPTLNVKLQDTVDGSTWYDVPNGAFAEITTAGQRRLLANNTGRKVRAVAAIGGSGPSITFDLQIVGA